eukprot:TRINITY_DN18130_c0_g1_i1.p1 TRINITY_DN18130_c0_g1~~TRINITY_DN18130_c0_g1_i1.p1  ORF type:complete len:120 (+),score=4.49 TRINITY_DN18130_c0_g1_i1:85-444(+)
MVNMKWILKPLVVLFAFAFVGSTSLHIKDFLTPDCGENNVGCDPNTCCYGPENTCCSMPSAPNGVGCCPLSDGVCCDDGHCCWAGLTCIDGGKCSATKPTNMTQGKDGVDLVPGIPFNF